MADMPWIISVDDHVVEPANVWMDRLPTKYHDVGPRIVRAPMGEITFVGGKLTVVPGSEGFPTDWWYYEDLKRPLLRVDSAVGVPRDEVTMSGITYEDMRPGSYEVKPRLEDMDVNHLEASLCFPTFPRFCGQTFTEAQDKELALLCVKAYNDWMVEEWCGPEAKGRLIPLTLIPLWDAELAAAEVRRNAERGRAGRLLQRDPALPRPALGARSRPLLGPVLPGLRRDRHRRQHAHRLVVQDAVHLGRRPAGGGLDPHPLQRHLLDGRLHVLGRAGPLPRPEAGLRRGPDRVDPLHPRAGRQGLGGEPGLGRRGRHRPRAAVDLLPPADLRLLLRRRLRAARSSTRSGSTTSPTSPTTPTPTPPGPTPARSPRSR